MKIVKVEPIPVAYPEPNDFNAERYLCLVKITTDDGLVGWGESITQFKEANFAVAALIDGLSEDHRLRIKVFGQQLKKDIGGTDIAVV